MKMNKMFIIMMKKYSNIYKMENCIKKNLKKFNKMQQIFNKKQKKINTMFNNKPNKFN